MLFETKRLYVIRWTKNDLDALYQIFNDEAIKESIGPELTIEETETIFNNQLNDYEKKPPFGRYFIVEKESNDCIGLFLLKETQEENSIEIGYSLIKKHWKKGYATEIVNEGVNWLFGQNKFLTIYAVTETDNINSQNVLLRCGFKSEENILEDDKEMNLFSLVKQDTISAT